MQLAIFELFDSGEATVTLAIRKSIYLFNSNYSEALQKAEARGVWYLFVGSSYLFVQP